MDAITTKFCQSQTVQLHTVTGAIIGVTNNSMGGTGLWARQETGLSTTVQTPVDTLIDVVHNIRAGLATILILIHILVNLTSLF